MLKTQAEIARLKEVTRLVISRFISKHAIQPAGKKGKLLLYDCSAEPLASYLAATQQKPHPSPLPKQPAMPGEPPPAASHKSALAAMRRVSKPLNDLLAGRVPSGDKPAGYFYGKALELAQENKDPALYLKLAQLAAKEDADEQVRLQMIKTEEAKEQIFQGKAAHIILENEIRRGEYMDKSTVKLIFGRQFAIDTSILQPLGLKLADTIDALPPGAGRRNKIQKLIDDEIFSALETKKRILADFIEAGGEETVDKKTN